MGYFTLTDKGNGQFHFNLKAGNHEIIGSSEIYESRASAENGIASVQKNCTEEARFEKKEAKNGKFYFNLKARNGQIILSSQMYSSESGRDNGIESVMKNGTSTEIKEESAAASAA